ncbi:MAG: CRISPR-associated DxTHG motif protein [Flavobacteriia bacterium]|nr:CRISPR-associated DxTHG motif protein [Flavobacteriia bacterium]
MGENSTHGLNYIPYLLSKFI